MTSAISKGRSLGIVALAYVLAVGAGAAWLVVGPTSGKPLLDALIADLVATLVVFAASRIFHNSSFYDAYWSVIPLLLMLWWWLDDGRGEATRQWLVALVMLVWAVRLTANWVKNWPGLVHEDWRYPHLRSKAPKLEFLIDLFPIHVIPTLQVFLALVPVWAAMTHAGHGFWWLDVVALIVGIGAVLIETVADVQLQRHVRDHPGTIMQAGLWSWSRHPNYFGEFCFWVSMALFGIAAMPAAWWWLWTGAAGILAILLFASIPMIEERSLRRRPGYQQVIDRVPMFVPRPRRDVIRSGGNSDHNV